MTNDLHALDLQSIAPPVSGTNAEEAQEQIQHTPCILWQAEIRKENDQYHWSISVLNEEGAQLILPLTFPPHETYATAMLRSLHPEDSTRLMESGNSAIRQGFPSFRQVYRSFLPNDEVRWLLADVSLQPLDERTWRADGVSVDVTDQKSVEETLRHQALHDPLTHLPNRTLFKDRVNQALIRAMRHQQKVAVLFLDLDGFKVINDSLGHKAGDQLLIAVGERLSTILRGSDSIARLGGDEFIVLIEEVTDLNYALNIAGRIEEQLQDAFYLEEQEVYISTSIGIAYSFGDTETADDLMRNADIALYEAKSKGKACHAVYDRSMTARAWRRLELGTDLRRALERRELKAYYQPVVDLDSGTIREVEALVRWEHPRFGLLSASEFIPLAEEIGMINPIGLWILEAACHQTGEWHQEFPSSPPLIVSVNLSDKQFQQPDLAGQILDTLKKTCLEPPCLKIEITESLMLKDEDKIVDTLRTLKEAGIQVTVDNFGTGYSSLSYLKRYQVDNLKLDRSFTQDLGQKNEEEEVISAIVAFANVLNLTVSGEGIETADQMEQLRDLGCPQGQGFYFSRPLSAEEMSRMLKTGS